MAPHSPLPRPEPGTVALSVSQTRVRLVLGGELDLATRADLLRAVQEAARHDRPVEVDTRHVTFLDSSAIAALSRLIRLTDVRPVFIDPPEVVRFLLHVTRIGDLVDVVDHDGEFPLSAAADLTGACLNPASNGASAGAHTPSSGQAAPPPRRLQVT